MARWVDPYGLRVVINRGYGCFVAGGNGPLVAATAFNRSDPVSPLPSARASLVPSQPDLGKMTFFFAEAPPTK